MYYFKTSYSVYFPEILKVSIFNEKLLYYFYLTFILKEYLKFYLHRW
jgi:hypothetical protein